MTGSCCDTLKAKFSKGKLSDEAQLVLREVKAWVEWVEVPLRDDRQRYDFNSRAVAYFYQVHGRFPTANEEWDFSHAGINGTVTGWWWRNQKWRYRRRINVNAVVKKSSDRLSDEEDRQLDEWIAEPWQQWKANEHIILAILQYKGLQGDAWDGTVSESFVVPKGGEEGSEQWHERLWGMELGQIASSLCSGARVLDNPTRRLTTAGFLFQMKAPKDKRARPSSVLDAKWDFYYRALRDYVDTHDGKLPKWKETYAFEGTVLSLGVWVNNQLSLYGKLRDVRREPLEQIPAFLLRVGRKRCDKSNA
jgi:hypothetical protein